MGIFIPMLSLANSIFVNGSIYTVNPKQPWAEAIVIENEHIAFVGSNTDAMLFKNSASKVIDLRNRFVMPGIIDAHTHTAIAALLLNRGVNLLSTKGKEDILQRIKEYAEHHQDEPTVTGFGFFPYSMGRYGPTARQLDSIISDKNVFLISNNGHSAWINSKTMAYLGIDSNTKDPLPGMHYYVRDHENRPTGFMVEGEAFWPHLKAVGIGTQKDFYKTLKHFLPQLSRFGITAVFDAGTPAVEENAFAAIKQLEDEDNLPLRYFGSHFIVSAKEALNAVEDFNDLQERFATPLLKISSVKFSNDNSDDDNFAIQFDSDQLYGYLAPLAKNGIDVMIHTSHDTSVHQALDAIARARERHAKSQSRFALAHVNMVRDNDFVRFHDLNVIANIQPFNAAGGGYYEYRYMIYDEWEDKLVRFKTFFDAGVVVSASSDFPACNSSLSECTPFDNMQIAVTRQKASMEMNTPVLASKKECLSVAQIIEAYTINAAYQLHAEDEIGSLEVGKKADLIVLDQNLMTIHPKKIYQSTVEMTMLNGEIIYEKE